MKQLILKLSFVLLCLGFSLKSSAQVGFITSNTNDTVCNGTTGLLEGWGVIDTINTWQYDIGAGFTNIPNSDSAHSQSFFMIPNNTCYRFIHNLWTDTSAVFCIVVDDPSDAGVITGGGPQCGIANGTLTVTGANGTPLGWYSSTGGPFITTGVTGTSQTYNVGSTTYFAYMTKNGVCPVDTTIDTISITPFSNGGNILISGNDSVCVTSNSLTLNATGVVGTSSATQGWQSAPASAGPWTSLSNSTLSYSTSNLTATTYYHFIAQSGTICPADTSASVKITVDQAPIGGSLSGAAYYCGTPPANGTLNLTGQSGTVVKWEYSTNNGSSWLTGSCTGNTCNYSVSGNTIYRVEVDNGVCPSALSAYDTVFVSANSVAGTLSLTNDTLCAYSGGGLLTLSGGTANNYDWEYSTNGGTTWNPMPAFTGPNAGYFNLLPGTYIYHCIVQNNLCPTATSNTVSVLVNPSPLVTILTPDTTLEPGQTINVIATGTGNPVWTPANSVSNPTSFTTSITPYLPTDYIITVDDGSGCTNTDTLHVYMTIAPFTGFIANTLTPNNDNINDALFIENIEAYTTNKLEIFNEYGQSIYTASPYKNDWKGTYNGSRIPDGTYYYVLTITDLNKEKEYKGFITILGQ